MTKIKISKRLVSIASMVERDSIIIDVGCDHALLDVYLSLNNIIKKAIASDLRDSALEFAKKNISNYNVKNVDIRQGNGLSSLNEEDNVDTIVISGMGYKTILDILSDEEKMLNIKTLIIQSNNHCYDIRKNICKLGFYIDDEKIVLDGKIIYQVIKFKRGKCKYNKRQYFFGPVILKNKNEVFDRMIKNYINENNKIIEKLSFNKFFKIIKLKINNLVLKKEIWFK